MYQISETELANKINTFITKKSEQFPELYTNQDDLSAESQSQHYNMHIPTLPEKVNAIWTSWARAL